MIELREADATLIESTAGWEQLVWSGINLYELLHSSLIALKQQLVDSFYSNPRSFITNDPYLLKSDVYTYVETGVEMTVVVRFNRGFTQDDFIMPTISG